MDYQPGLTTDVQLSPDLQAPEIDDTIAALLARYQARGQNPERARFERRLAFQFLWGQSVSRRALNIWDFIEDAVTGEGGFSSGVYLFPHKAEVENGTVKEKLVSRMSQADYDRFADHICGAAWDLIASASDMIERKADGAADELLADFWANADGNGNSILDCLEFPHKQGRKYSVGLIFIDRPDVALQSRADDRAPENRPYLYSVPTRNVVDWDFDDDGELCAVLILEPADNEEDAPRLRIWTRDAWALYQGSGKSTGDSTVATGRDWSLIKSGPRDLGVVPCVPIWNVAPNPGRLFSESEMPDVAKIAQTVFNIDSEAREIERKCALFLAIPVKSSGDYAGGAVTVGTDSALVYDGDAGEPRWVSPDLTILERLDDRRQKKIASAYNMAGLGALAASEGTIQTKSGFHAEVEFSKTERRIASHAAMLEQVEKRLAILYLRYYGIDAASEPDLFSVTYPRDFGVRDMEKLINDTTAVLELNIGDQWQTAELMKLARARFPRMTDKQITAMVEETVQSRSIAAAQSDAVSRIQQMAKEVPRPVIPVQSMRSSDYEVATGSGGDPNA